MPDGHVITVLGPRPVDELGVIDAHDHLFLDSPALRGDHFQDADKAAAEVVDAKASGISTIVELTPIGLGRRPGFMRAVSEATGVNVIAATGYHRDEHYPPGHWVHDAPVDVLAERATSDLVHGMHPADWLDPNASLDPARAGVIKAGASYHHVSSGERRRLEALAIASNRTGAAIVVHTEVGTAGHDIVDLLETAGVATERIALAHLDRNPDAELHAEIAARGVTLEYDTIGRAKYHPDSVVLDLIEAVAGAGHLDRIVLGLDMGRRSMFRAWGGGPGMRYLMATFVPRLRRHLGDAAVDRILVANPARLYAIASPGDGAGT